MVDCIRSCFAGLEGIDTIRHLPGVSRSPPRSSIPSSGRLQEEYFSARRCRMASSPRSPGVPRNVLGIRLIEVMVEVFLQNPSSTTSRSLLFFPVIAPTALKSQSRTHSNGDFSQSHHERSMAVHINQFSGTYGH